MTLTREEILAATDPERVIRAVKAVNPNEPLMTSIQWDYHCTFDPITLDFVAGQRVVQPTDKSQHFT